MGSRADNFKLLIMAVLSGDQPSPWSSPRVTSLEQKVDFPGGSDGKVSVYNAGDLGSIPGSGRFPGEGNSNPFQYPCLENLMDGGAWCPWGCKESDTTE